MLIGCELFKNSIILWYFFRLLAIFQGGQHFNFFIKKVFAVQIKEAIHQHIRNFSKKLMNLHQLFFLIHLTTHFLQHFLNDFFQGFHQFRLVFA